MKNEELNYHIPTQGSTINYVVEPEKITLKERFAQWLRKNVEFFQIVFWVLFTIGALKMFELIIITTIVL